MQVKSLEKLWGAEEREFQIAWTYCLGALLPLTVNLCPEAVNTAWKLVSLPRRAVCTLSLTTILRQVHSRVKYVRSEEKSSGALPRDQELIWWSNYILFGCAAVSDAGLS